MGERRYNLKAMRKYIYIYIYTRRSCIENGYDGDDKMKKEKNDRVVGKFDRSIVIQIFNTPITLRFVSLNFYARCAFERNVRVLFDLLITCIIRRVYTTLTAIKRGKSIVAYRFVLAGSRKAESTQFFSQKVVSN